MNKVKCFDVVESVVEVANERFAPIFTLDEQKYDVLKNYCEAIDDLSDEFDGEYFEVDVDEDTMEVKISLECPDMTIGSRDHVFWELAKRVVKVSFSASGENVRASFVFPSIWKNNLRRMNNESNQL